jgi:threonine synthase
MERDRRAGACEITHMDTASGNFFLHESSGPSLGEGNTPLLSSLRIGRALGLSDLRFKWEGANPSGSYKDRFAYAAVARMIERGIRLCLGTSSGNTGAALAAYCARSEIRCVMAIVEGAPEEKLLQMRAYGARLVRIRGFGADPDHTVTVMEGLRSLAAEWGASLEISAYRFSPVGMAGVESLGCELAFQTGRAPAHVFSPAGGGGLTLAIARGLASVGSPAAVHCVQPAGNDTIVSALQKGAVHACPVISTTQISGLQVGSVLDGDAVIAACRASGGMGFTVEDDEVFEWQARLAHEEGIFTEPAGAVALAGAAAAARCGAIDPSSPVVCVVTGSGFKDGARLVRMSGSNPVPIVPDFAAFCRCLEE